MFAINTKNMAEEIENLDSINQDGDIDFSNPEAAKEAYEKTLSLNKQLFTRAKKAEGFENKDGQWVKAEKPAKPEAKPKDEPTLSTDYGLLAFLKVNNIEHADDKAFFFKVQSETGKKPEEILSSKYFQAELKEQQEIRTTKEAQPKDNNRGSSKGGSEAAVWAEKVKSGQATMADVPSELRIEVINIKASASKPTSPANSILDKISQNQSK